MIETLPLPVDRTPFRCNHVLVKFPTGAKSEGASAHVVHCCQRLASILARKPKRRGKTLRHRDHQEREYHRREWPGYWAVIAFLFFIFGSNARAETVMQRIEREARTFTSPCPREHASLCKQNQRNFIEQYVRGYAGDISAMGSTASTFTPLWRGAKPEDFADMQLMHLGIPENPLEACVWHLLALVHDPDPSWHVIHQDVVRADISRLSDIGAPLCYSRAEAIDNERRLHPLKMPSDDWYPVFPGERWSPPEKFDPKCLDSTVCDFGSDCPTPPPPPGCPR